MELSDLNGVGKTRLEALHAAGICSLRDLLYCFPVKYRDASKNCMISEIQNGVEACIAVTRLGKPELTRSGNHVRVACRFADDSGEVTGIWFGQPWMKKLLEETNKFRFLGRVTVFGGKKQMINPAFEKQESILPAYKPIEQLPQKTHRKIVREALQICDELFPENLPKWILNRFDLPDKAASVRALHNPLDMEQIKKAAERIAFEKMLLYQVQIMRFKKAKEPAAIIRSDKDTLCEFWKLNHFEPTGAQLNTLEEIAADFRSGFTMARMIQGDVGSGKTAVAAGAMYIAMQEGFQAVLMAPTEILARQHYQSFSSLFGAENGGILLGSMKGKEKKEALQAIASGKWKYIVGTHALISRNVVFNNAALCVVDEQHRFGVAQRTALINHGAYKNKKPHLLVMSATPIPRSLALVLYGDLDISVLDEMPPGRQPVKTRIIPETKRNDMYSFIRSEAEKKHQIYIVCPLVETSDTEDALKAVREHAIELARGPLAGLRIGFVYGTQAVDEKNAVLDAFSSGELDILVATTVIEVGVNVPAATVMIIESADRYGLAQLHQLRGRVGRGNIQSWCFLMGEKNDRLNALTSTTDGFEIARTDLDLRGPGELLGLRQSGNAGEESSILFGDMKMFVQAGECAQKIHDDPELAPLWEELVSEADQIGLLQQVSFS